VPGVRLSHIAPLPAYYFLSAQVRVEGGATAVVNKNTPTSVYLAYSGSEYQVEVFDPDLQRALRVVRAGRIKPIPGS
jgi:hypothetical protein